MKFDFGGNKIMIAKYISGNNVGNFSSEFKDTKGRWSDPYIAFMLKEKLISGYPDGMFKMSFSHTRTEIYGHMPPN